MLAAVPDHYPVWPDSVNDAKFMLVLVISSCQFVLIFEHVFVGSSVQPLLMVMPSVNPLGTAFGMIYFLIMHTHTSAVCATSCSSYE